MSDAAAHRRIMNIMARGRVTKVDDSEGIQLHEVRLLKDEAKTRVERFQQYGLTSVPKADAECVVLFPGGSREHGIILSVDDRMNRIRGMQPGEVCLYTDEGDYIALQRGNKLYIMTSRLELGASGDVIVTAQEDASFNGVHVTIKGALKITLDCPNIELAGNVTIKGDLQVDGDIHASGGITADGGVDD